MVKNNHNWLFGLCVNAHIGTSVKGGLATRVALLVGAQPRSTTAHSQPLESRTETLRGIGQWLWHAAAATQVPIGQMAQRLIGTQHHACVQPLAHGLAHVTQKITAPTAEFSVLSLGGFLP